MQGGVGDDQAVPGTEVAGDVDRTKGRAHDRYPVPYGAAGERKVAVSDAAVGRSIVSGVCVARPDRHREPHRIVEERKAEKQRGRSAGQVGVAAQAKPEGQRAQSKALALVGGVPVSGPGEGGLAESDEVGPVHSANQHTPGHTGDPRVPRVHDRAPASEQLIKQTAVAPNTHDAEDGRSRP